MAIIKCKMCGGDIELAADKTFGTCEFCGSTMTFPKVDDEQRAAAFNRGNHFRRIGEFDKALAVYERIVREDDTDAEAHWCCALCRFGIEYVEDPATYEYLPTCHRASFDSFLEDVDYLAAVEHSEGITKRQYQKDGAKIAEVQRGILATSQNAEPFDVFICYKESDENGNRTKDSLMAQDVYYQLTDQGYRVFFARITLEDVVGTEYEPYIFAALNSAKVMITIGTKPEYMNAVWVKNEWSRFLAMMKKDRHKLLLPCYRDMDPYDMPEQLSVLQSYDMSKIGFIQDLIRGIKKVLDSEKKADTVQETVVVQQAASSNVVALLKRGNMSLEDGEWDKADQFFEEVLNQDAECVDAYLGKLMAELQVRKQENLQELAQPFDGRNSYQKVLRFADEALKASLASYIDHINTRNENARLAGIYNQATELQKMAQFNAIDSVKTYQRAAELFASIRSYKDAAALEKACLELAESAEKDIIYNEGKSYMACGLAFWFEAAINKFQTIPGWKDADEQIVVCQNKLREFKEKEEAERLERERKEEAKRKEAQRIAKRNKKIAIIAISIICAVIAFIIVLNAVIIPAGKYKDAVALMDAGNYIEAISAFVALDGYKDSNHKIEECNTAILDGKYNDAVALMDAGKYEEAITAFDALEGYKDSNHKIEECLDGKYNNAVALMDAGKYGEAITAFDALDGYKNSEDKISQCKYANAVALMDAGKYGEAITAFDALDGYKDAEELITAIWAEITVRDTISAGSYHTVSLKKDGTVVATGWNECGQCGVEDWKDIIAISAGSAHTVGLKKDGTLVAVGNNTFGQCDVEDWEDIVAISAGDDHTVGLKKDGTLVAVGYNVLGNVLGECDVEGWEDVIAISAGGYHTVGLKRDGTLVAVGYNAQGQCDVEGWEDIVAISAGDGHTVGLKKDGTLVAVGDNNKGQCDVEDWVDIVAISAGYGHTVGLKKDGTVVAVGDNDDGQCNVKSWKDIVAISAGYRHTVGLKKDGTVVAVGHKKYSQCNVNDWKDIKLP